MGAQSTVLKWDVLRSIDSATFTGSYQAVGTKFTYAPRILKIINNSNKDITVSVDASSDYDFVPAGGFCLYDCGTNRGNSSPEMNFQKGMQIYVKGSAGTGSAYVVTLYAYDPTNTIPGE